MGYEIGVSTGYFAISKGIARTGTEASAMLGLPKKAYYATTHGVNFTQIDLESITEFKEPNLKQEMEKVRKLGIQYGFHGESYALTGAEIPVKLDSAIEDDYVRTHDRLITSLNGAGEIEGKYFLLHSSETTPFIQLGLTFQPTKLVDIYGRPFSKFLEENPDVWEWATKPEAEFIETPHFRGYVNSILRSKVDDYRLKNQANPSDEEIKKMASEAKKEAISELVTSRELEYGPERIAYFLTAKWMELRRDPLWVKICETEENRKKYKKISIEDEKFREDDNFKNWVPAVSAKYIYGHFHPIESKYADPIKILEKYKMYFVLETPTGFTGGENLGRFSSIVHMIYLCEEINSNWFGVALDAEHLLGNNIDPEKEIERMNEKEGEKVKVVHLGWPTPLHTAHLPLVLGSEQQIYIYKLMYNLRKKGFKDGYLIYERGSIPVEETILVIRKIVDFLGKEIKPEDLMNHLDFFGVGTGEIASEERQLVTIREHAFDPLKGMITVPEEEHGFFGRAAAEKYKQEEWRKEKYR